MILLMVGGLHGKKPLPSLVDEHGEDVIDEEWPGLARRDAGFKNTNNSDSARNAAHRANYLPHSTSDRDGRSIEWPRSSSHHRPRSPQRGHSLGRPRSPQCRCLLDRPRSPQRQHLPPPRLPPPEHRHSPYQPPDHLAPAPRQKRGRIDDDVDSNKFKEVVNTRDRVPVIKRARGLPQEDGLHSAGDDYRQREVGLRSRKEQHGEYTRR
ncbi:hypothetical protein BDN67DRAFT_1016733 [Paxillus ammoniavirescens]|nr:hypothetical protein BDN67DRAFT_1016733 [Paxillus ammoniavirescens]